MKITFSSPLIGVSSGNDIEDNIPLVLLCTVKNPELSWPVMEGYTPPVKSDIKKKATRLILSPLVNQAPVFIPSHRSP